MRNAEELAKGTEFAFDFSDWHNGPKCDVAVCAGWGRTVVYCSTCHCVSDLEAVGIRVNHEASKKAGAL